MEWRMPDSSLVYYYWYLEWSVFVILDEIWCTTCWYPSLIRVAVLHPYLNNHNRMVLMFL